MTSKVILVLGSLQNHAAVVDASRGGTALASEPLILVCLNS